MTYMHGGAALCHKLGIHHRKSWSSTCERCGAQITQAEIEEADDIRAALEDIEREDLAAFTGYPDHEHDYRSHEVET